MTTKCRFLYLIDQLGSGGTERQLFYLLQRMNREQYKPAVTVWRFNQNDVYIPRIRALGVPLYFLPSGVNSIVKLRALRRLVTKLKPEVFHSYCFYPNFAAYWATWGKKIVTLGSVRCDFITEKKGAGFFLGRLSSLLPHWQIYNNFAAAQTVSCSKSIFKPRIVSVVPNGVDLQHFQYTPLPSKKVPFILGVGTLVPRKRWDRLITAASALKRDGFTCKIRIAGEGPLRKKLEENVRQLGLTDTVEFLGHTTDVTALLASSSFLVHTSDIEGSPNIVMEAMACGRAIVATDAGDVPALIDDGKTGFVVQRGDQQALIKKIQMLIENTCLRDQMGKAGRLKAEGYFGLEQMVSGTFAVYNSVGWRNS